MSLARLLLTSSALGPVRVTRDQLVASVTAALPPGGRLETFTHDGDPREPALLHALFATPGSPSSRATLVFVHGKGGAGAEFWRDAVRALGLGYNVLVPELRAHAPSGGERISYGQFERIDLHLLIGAARERFGIDESRIGIDGCSLGSLVALHVAKDEPRIRALWLQSPFADLPRMARHYLQRATGAPAWAMAGPAYLLVRYLEYTTGLSLSALSPVVAARRVTCPTMVVHGEDDGLVPVDWSQPIVDALAGPRSSWRVPRCGHCHHLDEPQAIRGGEYVRRWTAFFAEHLGGAT